MSQNLVVFNQLPVTSPVDEDFNKLASGSSLPILSLMTSASEACKDGAVPANSYALKTGESLHVLGKNIDVVVVAYRLTALDSKDENGFVISHDFKSALFQQIIKKADSEPFGSGAMYGPEFLIWVPTHKLFATLLCGSKSARRMASGIKALIGQVATFGSTKIETTKFSWYAMTVAPSNAIITEVPTQDEVVEVVNSFTSAKGTSLELASDPVTNETYETSDQVDR